MKRKHEIKNLEAGIGLVELMISLAVFSFIMVWAYKSMISTSQTTAGVVQKAQVTQHQLEIRRGLETLIEKVGYNPQLSEFELIASETTNPDLNRIGVTGMYLDRSELRFTSDDDADGEIQETERYRIWLADDESASPVAVDPLSSQEVCPKPEPGADLPQARKLFSVVKGNTVVLAENVLCLEIRYYKQGLSGLKKCAKYYPEQQAAECVFNPNTETCVANGSPNSCVLPNDEPWERLWANADFSKYQPPALPDGSEASEEAYYEFIRDHVQKIEVGVLVASGSSVERVVVQKKINNKAWNPRLAMGCLPGMGALSCGSTSGGIPQTGGGSLPSGGGNPSIDPIGDDPGPTTQPTPTAGGGSPGPVGCKKNCNSTPGAGGGGYN